MPIINIESFLKDVGLEKFIASQGHSHLDKFNNLERLNVADKDRISGELVDIIQLMRRVVYSIIREKREKAGKDEKAILKAQEGFDEQFKKSLQGYLLVATVPDMVNEAYTEFQINRGIAKSKVTPVRPELMNFFVGSVSDKSFFDENFDLNGWVSHMVSQVQDEATKNWFIDACKHIATRVKDGIDFDSNMMGVYKRFCDSIFDNGPNVTSKQILYPGYPEIKKGVLVSFLRIILYPLTFVVDYLDKKRIYGLDELRLFKDGKEKPRDEQEAKKFQQERLLDYGAKKRLKEIEVELGKGKKQYYAVLDCFKGQKNPPNGTIIVFHGKNADIHTKSLIDNYRSICKGYRVIMMEYPGFEPSDGPLSKENISKVTYQLFEHAKAKNLIKGDVTVMGDEGFGCYYAALLAKKIDEKERGSCKGLVLSESFNSTNSDLSTFGKIASYISDSEHLDTGSVLRSLPKTITPTFLIPGRDFIAKIYPIKKEKPYKVNSLKENQIVPVVNYNKDSEDDISKKESQLNKLKRKALVFVRYDAKRSEILVCGKKPFVATSASLISKENKQEQSRAGQTLG